MTDQTHAGGTGTPTPPETQAKTFFIIRNWQPGQVVRIVFLTVDQAATLPAIPADALQIAIAPTGGL